MWSLIIIAAVVGFLIGMVFFRKPWNLPPAWGDMPTWLLAGLAAAAGWVGFVQLAILRRQIAEEIDRNEKRYRLLDKQLDEAERRARSEQRQLVEDVEVKFTGKTGDVVNNSKRPINDVTCKIMSKVDRVSLAPATAYSSGSSRDYQPSRPFTGRHRTAWHCANRARHDSRSFLYRSARSRCRSAAPVDVATASRLVLLPASPRGAVKTVPRVPGSRRGRLETPESGGGRLAEERQPLATGCCSRTGLPAMPFR